MRFAMTASRPTLVWTFCVAALPFPAAGQRLLDLPVRTSAEADALVTGAPAAFWNPAAVRPIGGRAEALIVDVRGASAIGIGSLALAGVLQLDRRIALAVAFQHTGIEDIGRTSTSPLPDPGTADIDVSEQLFSAAVSRLLGAGIVAGAMARFGRTSEIAGGVGVVELGAGLLYQAPIPLAPRLGAAALVGADGTAWIAGVEITPPLGLDDWHLRASWGAGSTPRLTGVTHRIAAVVDWQSRVFVSAGIASEPQGEERVLQPLVSATVRVSRYAIGVLREELPNDFGAVHSLRFSVNFQ